MNDDKFAKVLGTRIREIRKLKKISQLELAYDMGMSMNTISGIELGKISPKIDTIKKIAEKLNIDISELFTFSSHQSNNKVIRKKVENISQKLIDCDAEFLDQVAQSINVLLAIKNGKN